MLKKENRLKKTKEIDLVFKKGRSEFSKILGFKYLKNNKGKNRFAIIIGKKVSKKAVERNKIKRKVKAIILKENSKLKSNYDCVFIVLPEIVKKSNKEIDDQIITIFQKIKLYV